MSAARVACRSQRADEGGADRDQQAKHCDGALKDGVGDDEQDGASYFRIEHDSVLQRENQLMPNARRERPPIIVLMLTGADHAND